MAGSKFQYDESGGTFFYFLLAFQALVIIPCTYYFYPSSSGRQEQKRDKSVCHCDHCSIKHSRLRSKEPWRKAKQRFIKFLLFIGWIAMSLTAYKVVNLSQHDYVAYDPFEILEIDPAASMSEIKKAYRRLSLVYHPDKETGDEKKFMKIAKAYAALTDEEARRNWETYGNPDGPGATSFGIALPSWIVAEENSVIVLGLYALVFMVALPVAVGIWWHRSVKFGAEMVLLDTTQLYFFFIYKTPHMILKRVIMIIAASLEFKRTHNSEIIERPSDNVEVPQVIKELSNLNEKNKEKPLSFGYSIKARALIYAHMARLKLPPNSLEEDKLYIVQKCPYLLNEFVQCTSQLTMLALVGRIARMPNLDTMENAMKLCSCIVQALWDNKSAFLQLPHVTEDVLRHFTTRKRNIRTIKHLAAMKSDDRRAMLRSLNDDEYDDVMNVIAKMPVIDIEIKSEVVDDEDSCTITAGAIVTVTATLHRTDMSTLFDQEHVQDDTMADMLDEPSIQSPNIDVSPKTKKQVWDKKKKKGKSGKMKKKSGIITKAVVPNKKMNGAVVNNGVSHHAKVEEKSTKEFDEHESAGETDVESDSDNSNSGSEDHNGNLSDKKMKQENHDEEDAEWEKFQSKFSKKDKIDSSKLKKSHSVHCPFFPGEKEEFWWVYLVDKKKHSLITAPYLVTNLVEKEEVELKFTAPDRPGIYTYSVIVRSDSYIDFDVIKAIKLDVKEAKVVDLTKVQWDVSEAEEEKDEEESAVEDSDLATDDDLDDD